MVTVLTYSIIKKVQLPAKRITEQPILSTKSMVNRPCYKFSTTSLLITKLLISAGSHKVKLITPYILVNVESSELDKFIGGSLLKDCPQNFTVALQTSLLGQLLDNLSALGIILRYTSRRT